MLQPLLREPGQQATGPECADNSVASIAMPSPQVNLDREGALFAVEIASSGVNRAHGKMTAWRRTAPFMSAAWLKYSDVEREWNGDRKLE